MIDHYVAQEPSTNSKINECVEYYFKQNLTYTDLYAEYDRVNKSQPKKDTSENAFIKKGKLTKIRSVFMKECVLEALKRVCENKSEEEMVNPDSELNREIKEYKEDFNYYPDLNEPNFPDQL